jgi:hypothetical protein
MVERNFALYQRINRDEEFQRVLMDLLFGRMLKVVGEGEVSEARSRSSTRHQRSGRPHAPGRVRHARADARLVADRIRRKE